MNKLDEYYIDAGEWGYDRYHSAMASRNRFFVLAVLMGLIALCTLIALIVMLPLKTTQTKLIATNELGQLHEQTTIDASQFSGSELVDLSYVQNYFIYRERYDPVSVNDDNYKVQMWNSNDVNQLYMDWFKSDESHWKTLGKTGLREVSQKSIVKLDEHRYQIRFWTKDSNAGVSNPIKHWVAILEFTYSPENIPQKAEDQHLNTVGFTVTKYIKQREIQVSQ